jgi:hypothetical protein
MTKTGKEEKPLCSLSLGGTPKVPAEKEVISTFPDAQPRANSAHLLKKSAFTLVVNLACVQSNIAGRFFFFWR